MAVTKRTRFEVLKRDNYTCRYCRSVEGELTIDHVTPVTLGGTDDPSNLVAACRDCNAGKSSTSPDEVTVGAVADDHIRWSAAMRHAAEIRATGRTELERYVAAFDKAWQDMWSTPGNYEQSIESLYKAGLPVELLVESVKITINAYGVLSRFNYFCGVAWRHVNELQEIARGLLEEAPEGGS